jgi:acetyl/propionyl-CoA carboxylase alpha subunit
MRLVAGPSALDEAVEGARREAASTFGDERVFLERYLTAPRHIEIQVLGDSHGQVVHLLERECSVQRRHQKVIEETPSPALDRDLRNRMCAAAVSSMQAIGYRGAGTVECVLTPDRDFFFLEVNARLQVEHPATEVTTGVDLVEEQLRIAAGEGMSLERTPPRNGHAIECRVYAEDPRTFLPSPGTVSALDVGPNRNRSQRHDLGYDAGDDVPMFYDPLLGKVIAHGGDRANARIEMAQALTDLRIEGLKTNVPTLRTTIDDGRFRSGEYDTGILGA